MGAAAASPAAGMGAAASPAAGWWPFPIQPNGPQIVVLRHEGEQHGRPSRNPV